MTEIALVVPPGTAEPYRVEFERADLLRVLYRELDTQCLSRTPALDTPYGSQLTMWTADDALTREPALPRNDRGIRLCRAVKHDVRDMRGTIVITGGVSDDIMRWHVGLAAELLAALEFSFSFGDDADRVIAAAAKVIDDAAGAL